MAAFSSLKTSGQYPYCHLFNFGFWLLTDPTLELELCNWDLDWYFWTIFGIFLVYFVILNSRKMDNIPPVSAVKKKNPATGRLNSAFSPTW